MWDIITLIFSSWGLGVFTGVGVGIRIALKLDPKRPPR